MTRISKMQHEEMLHPHTAEKSLFTTRGELKKDILGPAAALACLKLGIEMWLEYAPRDKHNVTDTVVEGVLRRIMWNTPTNGRDGAYMYLYTHGHSSYAPEWLRYRVIPNFAALQESRHRHPYANAEFVYWIVGDVAEDYAWRQNYYEAGVPAVGGARSQTRRIAALTKEFLDTWQRRCQARAAFADAATLPVDYLLEY